MSCKEQDERKMDKRKTNQQGTLKYQNNPKDGV